jgi:probable phosphoglycerate mutase
LTRLILVRHGESVAQAEGFVGGHNGCRGLSADGRRQVEALRDRLLRTGEIDADVVLTSVMPRAIETAEILAPAFGGAVAAQHCELCEVHPGECDGLSWNEFETRYRGEGWAWSPDEPVSPGGESWREFVTRAGAAIQRVVTEHEGETIVVVAHGGIVRASFLHFLPLPVTEGDSMMVTNASLTEWRWPDEEPYDGRFRWILHRFNDAAHLHSQDPSGT